MRVGMHVTCKTDANALGKHRGMRESHHSCPLPTPPKASTFPNPADRTSEVAPSLARPLL